MQLLLQAVRLKMSVENLGQPQLVGQTDDQRNVVDSGRFL